MTNTPTPTARITNTQSIVGSWACARDQRIVLEGSRIVFVHPLAVVEKVYDEPVERVGRAVGVILERTIALLEARQNWLHQSGGPDRRIIAQRVRRRTASGRVADAHNR